MTTTQLAHPERISTFRVIDTEAQVGIAARCPDCRSVASIIPAEDTDAHRREAIRRLAQLPCNGIEALPHPLPYMLSERSIPAGDNRFA